MARIESLKRMTPQTEYVGRELAVEQNGTPSLWAMDEITPDVPTAPGPNWRGGITIDGKGYRLIWKPGHPRSNKAGYVREHILIAEKALGKPLPRLVVVHHVNERKAENENSNLVICQDEGYHALIHARMRILAAGGDPNIEKICSDCGLRPLTAFRKQTSTYDGLFSKCLNCHSKRENRRYHAKERRLSERNCECGCGQKTSIILVSNATRGAVRGEPLKFIRGHCNRSSYKNRETASKAVPS